MLLKKIKLKNIRSYIGEEIKFPDGVTLLSGDVGAGKSTILLAIDFALFGIRRGELSGSALLRSGANEGHVILDFSISDKEVSIKRILKKTNNGISQDAGYLTIDDVTQEFTPVELKQRILQLLNYPPELLTKKSLIYRYTVYTPQEEMKLILLGEKEDRLHTLRKVFNIDKYKRISDNSKIVLAEIKQKKKEFLGVVSDLNDKKIRLLEKDLELEKLDRILKEIDIELLEVNKLITKKKEIVSSFENQIIKLNNIKNELNILTNKFNLKEEQKFKNHNQIKLIENQILIPKLDIKIDLEDLKTNIVNNEKAFLELEKELRNVIDNIIELKSRKKQSREIKENVINLDVCPLCKQNISEDHKHSVLTNEDSLFEKLDTDLKIFVKKEDELKLKINEVKQLIQDYKNQDKEFEIYKIRQKELEYKKEIVNNIKKEQEEIGFLLKETSMKKQELEKDMYDLRDTEKNYQENKKELNELLEKQRKIEINLASTSKESETMKKDILYLKKEIGEKEIAKQKLDYYTKLQDWFDNFFINIIELIERKVMLKVHMDFNDLLQKWFGMLIEGELIKVKLDEEFTPLIEQNGYDLEYENLSGGEKTACALSYRLALNQVINNIASSVNTKDIIILDEPTDGFSSEQLDKIKLVLEELKMGQIIIVSHESKIESFVDNVIKIQKDGHVSKIIK